MVNKVVWLIGLSGAGKTTIANLIPRFIDPNAGRVLIDGQNIADYSLDSLRAQISFVFQETSLFDATVADNMAELDISAPRHQCHRRCQIRWPRKIDCAPGRIQAPHDETSSHPDQFFAHDAAPAIICQFLQMNEACV